MSEPVFKKIEVTGTSAEGQDAAIQNAIAKAAKTVHNMRWYEVVESRGNIKDGKVGQYQVTLKIGFRLEE
jgi:flavin-binding protein dodecin